MPKTKISEFSSTPANNTDIDSINIAEGCAPSGINDAIRELMAQLKDFQVGSAGDPVTVGGVLTVTAGAVGTPAITTAGDTNTGIFFPAADTIAFAEGGVEAMRIDSSGNVGVGTVSPGTKLQVLGTISAQIGADGSNATGVRIYGSGSDKRVDFTGSDGLATERISGVGTGGSGILTFSVNNSSSVMTERARIDSSGNVGIGQIPSVRKFEINAVPASSNQLNGIRVQMNGVATSASEFLLGTTASGVPYTSIATGNDGNSFMTFSTGAGPTERARIDSGGNFFVGKSNTSYDVNGFAVLPNGQIRGTANNDSSLLLLRNGSDGAIVDFWKGGAGPVGAIMVTNSNTSYATSSDYRLKNTIAPMTGALAKIAALKPCTYKWNIDGSDGQGFIAHELAEVVPGCVTGEKDAIETYTDEDGNEQTRPSYQGIDTSFLVATLTAAIQEQQALITAQQAAITALTDRITALEAK
jgi:hypothetical protein